MIIKKCVATAFYQGVAKSKMVDFFDETRDVNLTSGEEIRLLIVDHVNSGLKVENFWD